MILAIVLLLTMDHTILILLHPNSQTFTNTIRLITSKYSLLLFLSAPSFHCTKPLVLTIKFLFVIKAALRSIFLLQQGFFIKIMQGPGKSHNFSLLFYIATCMQYWAFHHLQRFSLTRFQK